LIIAANGSWPGAELLKADFDDDIAHVSIQGFGGQGKIIGIKTEISSH